MTNLKDTAILYDFIFSLWLLYMIFLKSNKLIDNSAGFRFHFFFTILTKICDTNFSVGVKGLAFHVKSLISVFQQFFASISKISILGSWCSWFFKILSLKSLGNSWGSCYVTCLLLVISICFTFGQRKIW